MKNQITFKGGLALMAMSLIFLSSCKKEEVTKKPIGQSENQATETPPSYKFSAVAKIPGENPENGFLSLKVSSNDEAFLKKYVAKLEQTKVIFAEVNSSKMDEKDIKPLFSEEESKAGVGLDFNWDNFSFKREKGQMYQLRLASADQSKSLVQYTAFNSSQFSYNFGFAAVNIYSLNSATIDPSCLCMSSVAKWKFSNGSSDFLEFKLTYHDNLEIRCFQNPSNNTSPTYTGFPYFTINGIVTYFAPRYNYVSPNMPAGFMDVNAITSGYGTSHNGPSNPPNAAITLYITG